MRGKVTRLLLVGVAAYLLFLAATFPASYAYWMLRERFGEVTLSGIDGSVWSGSAREVRMGRVVLHDVHWRGRLLPLLAARLEVAVESRGEPLRFTAYLGRTLGGTLYFRELTGKAPLPALQRMTPYSAPALGGNLRFQSLSLALAQEGIHQGEGEIFWDEAAVILGKPLSLGGFSLVLESDKSLTRGRFQDTGGPLQVSGIVELEPNGTYRVRGRVIPREEGSEIARGLRVLGPPDAEGGYPLELEGRIVIPGSK